MSRLRLDLRYVKGVDDDLDKKWNKYKTTRVFNRDSWSEALTEEEIDHLADIWRKKRLKPWKLTFREVSTYVELSERVVDYRKRAKRGCARPRKHQSIQKMKAAAKQGDLSAITRIETIKKYNRDYMAKIRKGKKNDPSSK